MFSKQRCMRQGIPGFQFAAKLFQHNRHHEVFLSSLLMSIKPFPAQQAILSAAAAGGGAGGMDVQHEASSSNTACSSNFQYVQHRTNVSARRIARLLLTT